MKFITFLKSGVNFVFFQSVSLLCFLMCTNQMCHGFHHYHSSSKIDYSSAPEQDSYALEPTPLKENPYGSSPQMSTSSYGSVSDTSYFSAGAPEYPYLYVPVENQISYGSVETPYSAAASMGSVMTTYSPLSSSMAYPSVNDNGLPYLSSSAGVAPVTKYSYPQATTPSYASTYPVVAPAGDSTYPPSSSVNVYQYAPAYSSPYVPASTYSSYPSFYVPYASPAADLWYPYTPPEENSLMYPPTEPYPSTAGSNIYPYVVSKPKYFPSSPSKENPYRPDKEYSSNYSPVKEDEELYNSNEVLYYEGEPYIDEYEEQYYDEYFQGREILDNKGRYLLQWIVDYPGKIITFNITIQNKGWVALGLSKDGTMKNADIMIGGIKNSGAEPYLGDYFSDHERKLYSDAKSDWTLIYAESVRGMTHLQVSRRLDTCDSYDHPITEDLVHVIWAYGETAEYDYHFDKRGSFKVYLLDPILKSHESSLNHWRVAERTVLAPRETSYWCSIHKSPTLFQKQHIIEVHPYIPDSLSLAHTHHILLWRCVAPAGMSSKDIFEPLLAYPGEECYFTENHVIPVNLCRNLATGWAIGGKPYILPYEVGFPMAEETDEFWMVGNLVIYYISPAISLLWLETHYSNPEELTLTLSSGFDMYYTDRLRKHDGESMLIGYDLFGLYIIPPISVNFEVYGICSTECTQQMIPPEGIKIVSVLLHAHNSAKKIEFKHFRNGEELEPIMQDNNYDNTFQTFKNLYEPRLVLPGDVLVARCEYDNRWTNETVVNGFATREEMCLVGIVINRRIPYFTCTSQVSQSSLLKLVGVRDYEWDIETGERIVTSPRNLKGQFLSDVCDAIDWTKALRYKIQGITTYTPQNGSCPQILIPTPVSHDIGEFGNGGALQHHEFHHQRTLSASHIKAQQNKMRGTVMSADADPEDILTYAKGYGTDTIMGEQTGVPRQMPGVASQTIYPYDNKKYQRERYCSRSLTGFYKYSSYSKQSS